MEGVGPGTPVGHSHGKANGFEESGQGADSNELNGAAFDDELADDLPTSR